MFQKNYRRKQIVLVLFIFFATTGLLFGGERLAERFLEGNPLAKKADSIKEIRDYSVTEDQASGEFELNLELDDVDNLQETVEPFIKEIQRIKGRQVTKVKIESPLAAELRDIFYELSFSVEEAKASGRYKHLFTYLEEVEEAEEGHFRVYIGEEFFFVQLEKGQARYYSVISRRMPFGTGSMEGGRV